MSPDSEPSTWRVFGCLVAILGGGLTVQGCAVLSAPTPTWSEFTTGRVAAETTLAYESHGSGSPILLIHGLGANRYSWRHLVPVLSRYGRVIAVDLKGFGRSSKPRDERYSLYDQAALIRAFINRHDLRDVTLIGHSFGGSVALVTALDLGPRRVRRAILIDTAAYDQPLPRFVRILKTPVLNQLVLALFSPEYHARKMLQATYHDDTRITEQDVSAYAGPLHDPDARHALLRSARQIVPDDLASLSDRVSQLRIPVLLLWGKHDTIVPLEIGQRLHRALPRSTLAVIEAAGHAPHEERPAVAAAVIAGFLERFAPDGAGDQ